jgi:prepilin-type N-terminal cleavage/methylation domain-containing protein
MSRGSVQVHPASDDGFSFVELLVALSLLLITLVAVMGLSMTTSFMAQAARQRAAMVNAGASYLERVRQMSYADVGTATSTPTGTLVAVVTTSTPYVITVTPFVTPGPNASCKTVTLSVVSSLVRGGSQMTYTTSAVVADVGRVSSVDRPDSRRRPTSSDAPIPAAVSRDLKRATCARLRVIA